MKQLHRLLTLAGALPVGRRKEREFAHWQHRTAAIPASRARAAAVRPARTVQAAVQSKPRGAYSCSREELTAAAAALCSDTCPHCVAAIQTARAVEFAAAVRIRMDCSRSPAVKLGCAPALEPAGEGRSRPMGEPRHRDVAVAVPCRPSPPLSALVYPLLHPLAPWCIDRNEERRVLRGEEGPDP